MKFSIIKNRFFSAHQLSDKGIATLLPVIDLPGPVRAEKKRNSIAVS
jgi:hypothetical protein